MMYFLFLRRIPESLRETRLLFRTAPEAPRENPKAVLDRLALENASEENLEQTIADLPEGSDVYRAVVEEGQKLDHKQRQIVGANLRRLSERISLKAKTQTDQVEVLAKVERMRSALAAPVARPEETPSVPESGAPPEPAVNVPAVSAPAETEQSLWTRGWEQVGKYWDQTSPTVKKVSAAVGVAALAYGAYRFVNWLWGGTKKAAEKTVEKTKEGMGWFTKTVIAGSLLAVAGVAGYIGMAKAKEYFSSMAGDIKKAVTDQTAAAKKEIQDAAVRSRDAISEHGSAAAHRVREAVHEGAEKMKEKKKERAERTAEAGPAAPVKEKAEAAAKKADEYAPGVAVFLLSKYLKSDRIADVYEVLKGKKLSEILATYDPIRKEAKREAVVAFGVVPAGAEGPEAQKYEDAAQKLVTFCGNRAPEARVLYEKSRKPTDPAFDDLTLEQYVLSLGGGISLAADAVEFSHDLSGWKPDLSLLKRIKEGSLSIGRKMRDLKIDRLSHLSAPLQEMEMREVMQYLIEAEGGVFAQRKVRAVLAEAPKFRLTEAQIAALPPDEQKSAKIHMLVLEICEKALPTGRELLPFFHRTFPDRNWGADETENAKVVDQYVQEMSVAQALRFFSYWQMIRSQSSEEQVGGLVALQYEVLQFIDRNDPGYFGGLIKPKFKSAVVGLTEDLASPTFGEALAEVAKVDASIVARMCEMLKEPAERLAYYAGLAALGPAKYLAEWGLGTWEKHPVGAPLVAGTAAYGLLSPVRFMTNAPFKLGWWWYTRKDPSIAAAVLKNPWQRFSPFRRAYGLFNTGAHYASRQRAGSILSQISEKIHAIPDEAAQARLQRSLERCLRSGAGDAELADFENLVRTVRGGSARPAAFDELLQLSGDLAREPRLAGARQALQLYARPFREQVARLRMVREMRAAGLRGSMLWGLGLAAQGYAAFEDWRDVGEKVKEKNEVMTAGVNVLAEVREKIVASGQFEASADGRTFKHKSSGVEVDLHVAERQLSTLEGGMSSRVNAQVARATVSTGALVGLALMGPRLAMGPAGLVVVGVELTIRGGIAVWEQSKMRKFIEESPPWVLAALGLQPTTGTNEEDWLNNASSWMTSDVLWLGEANANKERIRDRVLFTVFCRDLSQAAPEVMAEIFDGLDTPDRLDAFFDQEFKSLVLPYFSVALFAHSADPNARWSNARAIDTDSGWLVVPPRTTMVDIRRAMREAAVFTLQHVREQRYLKLLGCRDSMQSEGFGEEWEDIMKQVGGLRSLGQVLRESSLTGGENKTRTELLLTQLLHVLNDGEGDTRAAKIAKSPDLLQFTSADVAGLPAALDLRTADALFSFVDDPATRLKLQDVRAQTLGEEEAHEGRRWNDWSLSRITHVPSAVDQMDALLYSAPFHAANMIAGKLGEPPLHTNTSILDLLGRSRDSASYDTARTYITEGLDRLFTQKAAGSGEWRRSTSYEEFYGENGPVVFLRGKSYPRRELASFIKYPGIEAPGFEEKNMQAVLFEGVDLGGNHAGVLATYVFGDLDSGKVSVLQRGSGTFMLSQMMKPGLIEGIDRPLTLQEFLARPGAGKVLDAAKTALAQKRAAREEARRKQSEEARAVKESGERQWVEERGKRAQQKQEREQFRTRLRDQFRQAGTLGYIPGSYFERDATDRRDNAFFEESGNVEGRVSGADVSFHLPSESELLERPAASAQTSPPPFYLSTYLEFHAEREGKAHDYKVILGWMRDPEKGGFSPDDLSLIRDVITTPINLSAHPKRNDEAFVEAVRKYELRRLLKMAHYRAGAGWNAWQYEHHLFEELWPLYRDSSDKRTFLNTLLNNLLEYEAVTGGAFSSPYRTILKNMKG